MWKIGLKSCFGDKNMSKDKFNSHYAYMCGKNDLPEEAVDCIKDITLHQVERGVCGTPDEIMSLFICEECLEKPEKKK